MPGTQESGGELVLLVPPGPSCPRVRAAGREGADVGPHFAYATAFVAGGREPGTLAGNFELPGEIDFGASVALVRRSALIDLLRAGDEPRDEAELFAALASRGHFGVVIHEALVQRLPRRSGSGKVDRRR